MKNHHNQKQVKKEKFILVSISRKICLIIMKKHGIGIKKQGDHISSTQEAEEETGGGMKL